MIYPHIEIREIERDEEIIRMLTQLEGEFWNNYVVETKCHRLTAVVLQRIR